MPAKIAEREFYKLKERMESPIQNLQEAENMVWDYLTAYPKGGFEDKAKALLNELPVRYEQEAYRKLNEDIEQLGDRYEGLSWATRIRSALQRGAGTSGENPRTHRRQGF